jgi:DNA-binding MarR family transcriptional regulator
MSEIALIASALPRIQRACRTRVPLPGGRGELTLKQARTLQQLDTVDPAMVTELAEYLGVTASTMSLNLKRMEEAGLVRRARDPADRRVMNVLLTEEGVVARDRSAAVDVQRVAAVIDRLRPEERRAVAEAFARFADAAEALADPAAER